MIVALVAGTALAAALSPDAGMSLGALAVPVPPCGTAEAKVAESCVRWVVRPQERTGAPIFTGPEIPIKTLADAVATCKINAHGGMSVEVFTGEDGSFLVECRKYPANGPAAPLTVMDGPPPMFMRCRTRWHIEAPDTAPFCRAAQ